MIVVAYDLLIHSPFVVPPRISLSSTQACYNEGSAVNVNCAASGTPNPDVQWFRDGKLKSSGKKTSFLTFSSVTRADDGLYACRANNSAGNNEKRTTLVVYCKRNFVLFSYTYF